MKGVPHTTELSRQLPKSAVYKKFEVSAAQQAKFDADISKMVFSNIIDAKTIPAIKEGENVKAIYVLSLILKRKEYDSKNIMLLSKLIPQKMVFVLQHEEFAQLAIYHDKLHCGKWLNIEDISIVIDGFSLDEVWDNIVKSIGQITVEGGNSLSEQIAIDDNRKKMLNQIELLEKQAKNERQPRRKMELFDKIQELKKQLQ